MNYISKKEAAERLGCSMQSISNYACKGYFDYLVKDGVVYVDEVSFTAFVDSGFEKVSANNEAFEALARETEQYKQERAIVKTQREYLAFVRQGMATDLMRVLVDCCSTFGGMTAREQEALVCLIKGYNAHEIATDFDVSRERVRQLVYRALTKMRRLASVIKSTMDENAGLAAALAEKDEEIRSLKFQLDELMKQCHIDESTDETKHAIYMKTCDVVLTDTDLSVRALNSLKNARVATLWELLFITKDELLRMRNTGKKSIAEIEDFLAGFTIDGVTLRLGMFKG